MAAVASPKHSPSPSPKHQQYSPKNMSSPPLPPLNTGPLAKRSPLQRPPSYAKNRMSAYSVTSRLSEARSRPSSHAFPAFHSSLSYTLVRDFAYPPNHPMHYGPPPDASENASGNSTPASERQRRLSDPPSAAWDGSNPEWSTGPWAADGFLSGQQLQPMTYGDGPPYSEDDDLHSPVVASRHKKPRSGLGPSSARHGKGRLQSPTSDRDYAAYPSHTSGQRSYFAGVNGDGTETYYIGDEDESANGPGGELVTYPPDQMRPSLLAPNTADTAHTQRDSHFAMLPNRSYLQEENAESDTETGSGYLDHDDSRYSREYQFTIASPDEEMHGKAVALFDFARENENELPLVEGQIIWVSYRHGQGWLVAEDPKTGDAGLVPEEYVRLLRDIEGGWSSLSGEDSPTAVANSTEENSGTNSPPPAEQDQNESVATPTQASSSNNLAQTSNGNNSKTEKRPPIVSTFSTSSKDLDPYPHHVRGTAKPPTIVHQTSSQTNTPTILSPDATGGGVMSASSSSRSLTNVSEAHEGTEGHTETGEKR